MIKETELFKQGWRRFGDDEDDPFYKLILDQSVFGLSDLAGNFKDDGTFDIYSMYKRTFNDISEIQKILDVCQFKPNWDIINRYGSSVPKERVGKKVME